MMGRRTGGDADSFSPVRKASLELQAVLANNYATAKEIQSKLAALREAKQKSESELALARKSLSELLTQRQEVQLVLMGILE